MTQAEQILAYMRERPDGITALEALRHIGCMRLAARIADLERSGHHIVHEMVTVEDRHGQPVRVARYSLAGQGVLWGVTDEVGTVPAFDIPEDPRPHTRYVCSSCGRMDAQPDLSRPSLDPRFAIGYCMTCTPMRKASDKGREVARRATVVLVPEADWHAGMLTPKRPKQRLDWEDPKK